MVNLFYDAYSVLCKVYFDGAFIDKALYSTNIEPLNKAKTVKICYGVLDKDVYLDYVLNVLCDRLPKQKIRLILKIAIYSIFFLDKKPFTVINSAVELTKKLGKSGNAGFVNAVLRRYSLSDITLPTDKTEKLSVLSSTPLFAVKKLIDEYGFETTEKILYFDENYNFVRFPTAVDGDKYLSLGNYEYIKTPFPDLFSVKKLFKNDDFDNGIFTFQSIGSRAICDIVGSGKDLFDACAAPGGKTCALAEKFERVVAAELYEHRAQLITQYCKRMRIVNVSVVTSDSSVYIKDFAERFDVVLCDVLCSGYGTVKDNPDIKLRRTEKDVSLINNQQYAILSNASKYVKPSGSIVYSTCSYFKEENDDVIERFLTENDGFKAEKIASPLPSEKKKYGLQFLPHISMGAGYYCAKLKRIK